MKYFYLGVFLLSLVSCKSAPPPAWYSEPLLAYPDANYFGALGAGKTPEEARSASLRVLSYQFVSLVDSRYQESLSAVNGKVNEDISLYTTIASNSQLQGVQFTPAWKNKREKMYYTYAFIDKASELGRAQERLNNYSETFLSIFSRLKGQKLYNRRIILKELTVAADSFLIQYYWCQNLDPASAGKYFKVYTDALKVPGFISANDSEIQAYEKAEEARRIAEEKAAHPVREALKDGAKAAGGAAGSLLKGFLDGITGK